MLMVVDASACDHRNYQTAMIKAGIPEAHRTSKGLRHANGVNTVTRNIPLNMPQKWMGLADMKTLVIYANAVDEEEAGLAAKMRRLARLDN